LPNITPLWFFDLDNTLHDAAHAIFPAINANMNNIYRAVLAQDGMPAHPDTVNAAHSPIAALCATLRYDKNISSAVEDFLREAHPSII